MVPRVRLARPTRHRNSSDELPAVCLQHESADPRPRDDHSSPAGASRTAPGDSRGLPLRIDGPGAEQPHSDLDVAVFIDEAAAKPGGFGYQATLTADLMAGMGTNAVDVVILNRAPPLLYHRVLRDGIRIITRDLQASTTREARALSRYCDFVPQLDKIDAASRITSPPKVTEP